MGRKIFAVCDKDREYVKRFSGYAGRREGNPFDIHAFTEKEALQAFLRTGRADILLVGVDLYEDELEAQVRESGGVLLYLSGTPGDTAGNCPVVYKYQSTERILRDVMACYEENHPRAGRQKNLRARIDGVYSPVGRCYKTTFSLALGQILAERSPTLYLNLEDLSGFPGILKQTYEEDLSDVLYYYRVVNPGSVNLYRVARNLGKLVYVPPVSCPEDIRSAPPEELAELVQAMGATDTYEHLVLDLGQGLADPLPLLRLCRRIYMPVREDAAAQAKVDAWMEQVRARDAELLHRIQKISIPRYAGWETGGPDYRSLKNTALGKYVEQMIKEEEDAGGRHDLF